MNKDRLKEYVNALDALSDDVKDWGVAMLSTKEPACGTPGCHAGLISIVAQDLPELQDIYMPLYLSESGRRGKRGNQYFFYVWADALAEFLGFKGEEDLETWAEKNPRLWGNKFGGDMFLSQSAFANGLYKKLTHRDIINHWKQVLKKVEEEGVKNDE
jgi:hypothetical protein